MHFYSENGHFASPFASSLYLPLGTLETMYAILLRLIRKLAVDFLVIIELFSIGVTAEALRANID